MYRIDNATSVAILPAPAAVGPNPNSFFFKGNPGAAIPATIVDDDWANAVQEEICNVIEGSGQTLDKTKRNQLLNALLGKLARIRLTGNTSFYVLATGNDANTGTANTAGGAWLTLQHGLNVLQGTYDFAGFAPTLNVGAGSFAGGGVTYSFVGLNLNNQFTINGVGSTTIFTSSIGTNGANLLLQNMKFVCPSDNAVTAGGGGGALSLGAGIEYGACSLAHIYANTGTIFVNNSYAISGGAASHYQAYSVGKILVNAGITVTLTGTPAFSAGFAQVNTASCLVFGLGGVATFTGAATGARYAIDNMSLISTGSSGPTYLPGSISGTNVGHGATYN